MTERPTVHGSGGARPADGVRPAAGRSARPARAGAGFTLVELLVVVGIMAVIYGMITMLPQGTKRDADVKAAAEELAGTLRQARAMAMDKRCVTAVAFNIQNAPGTSGKLLNNFSGGHWYRIVGPNDSTYQPYTNGAPVYPYPLLWSSTLGNYLNTVKTCWVGDRHVLTPRHVRFLALSDQDNGALPNSSGTPGNTFLATYPRPWCGYWDPATHRMFPWGGYDPTILDAQGRQCSGFYFAGKDGTITGCLNPADRFTTTAPTTKVFSAGTPRALVSGDWLDYMIHFLPDGTAHEAEVMVVRQKSWTNAPGGGGATAPGDLGDLCCQANGNSIPNTYTRLGSLTPLTSYVGFTGYWSITLAPDIASDSDVYPNAQAAYDSIMPAYRVMVNHFGNVRVVKVRAYNPGGYTLDTTTITSYQTASQVQNYYQGWVATTTTGGNRGMPVSDFLTPDVLSQHAWWMK